MKLSNFIDEDFANYSKPAMFLGTTKCDGKCWREKGLSKEICQNHELYDMGGYLTVPEDTLIERYLRDPITSAIVIGGLEPLMDPDEVLTFIKMLRVDYACSDDVVIYTGYNKDECEDFIRDVSIYPNIIMKFGRYVPDAPSKYDEVLGIQLVSDNQYAERIS